MLLRLCSAPRQPAIDRPDEDRRLVEALREVALRRRRPKPFSPAVSARPMNIRERVRHPVVEFPRPASSRARGPACTSSVRSPHCRLLSRRRPGRGGRRPTAATSAGTLLVSRRRRLGRGPRADDPVVLRPTTWFRLVVALASSSALLWLSMRSAWCRRCDHAGLVRVPPC